MFLVYTACLTDTVRTWERVKKLPAKGKTKEREDMHVVIIDRRHGSQFHQSFLHFSALSFCRRDTAVK